MFLLFHASWANFLQKSYQKVCYLIYFLTKNLCYFEEAFHVQQSKPYINPRGQDTLGQTQARKAANRKILPMSWAMRTSVILEGTRFGHCRQRKNEKGAKRNSALRRKSIFLLRFSCDFHAHPSVPGTFSRGFEMRGQLQPGWLLGSLPNTHFKNDVYCQKKMISLWLI